MESKYIQGKQRLLQAGARYHDVPVGIVECVHGGWWENRSVRVRTLSNA